MDRFSATVDGDGVLTLDTGKITLGPAAGRARPAGHHPAADPDGLHLMTDGTTRRAGRRDDRRAAADRPEGTPAAPEERLPATRPPEQLRPSGSPRPPPVKATAGLTPERSAQIVRQSSSARWVGFLTVVFVSLFIVGYWFYELGAPLGHLARPASPAEINAQQVTVVERGYNLYEANCARCHGPNGLGPERARRRPTKGYIGPQLNAQEKLFAHLNAAYLRNVLTVGGRYVCGNANSQMPVWSDQGNPPGPLNYRQIDELIAFLRAPSDGDLRRQGPFARTSRSSTRRPAR